MLYIICAFAHNSKDNSRCNNTTLKVEMRVLQLNIWVECTKAPDALNSLIDQIYYINPDIVTFCELFKYGDESILQPLVAALKAKGLSYECARVEGRAILSKYKIIETSRINDWSFKAILDVSGKKVAVYPSHSEYRYYSCYCPRGYGDGVVSWEELKSPVTDSDVLVGICRNSGRIESAEDVVADAQLELAKGSLVIYAGDFNEPSHLDWTEKTKDMFGHNSCVVKWPLSVYLTEIAGFKDAYRVKYRNPVTHPGITFPSECPGLAPEKISWAPKADERDRIDMIYYFPDRSIRVKDAFIAGPNKSISYNSVIEETGKDIFISNPDALWPSDHKGVLVVFEITTK